MLSALGLRERDCTIILRADDGETARTTSPRFTKGEMTKDLCAATKEKVMEFDFELGLLAPAV